MAVIEGMKSFERNEGSQEFGGFFWEGGGGGDGKFSKSIAFPSSENNIF